ncbi:MAG: glycosyltransferase [Xanthobacteraceae bacterium]|nr:glycosyltransferase [Xanthobacteraceae bacterium]
MRIVVFGLTISSSWGNGHATLWRGLCRALARLGHSVRFYERDVPYYAGARDCWDVPGGKLILYPEWADIAASARRDVAEADVAIVTSYCPDGIAATDLVLGSGRPLCVFYDLDTPVTLSRLHRGEALSYIGPEGLTGFDLVLSYTGGAALEHLQARLGARLVAPLYGHVDPDVHRPAVPADQYCSDLSYLGTFAVDRQAALESLFVEPARHNPDKRFLIGGAQYPADFPWCANIYFVRHLPPGEHPAFFCSSRLTLNVTRFDMAAMGWCPSGRLFEAAACGATVLTDGWPGLETFFTPDNEILVADGAEDVQAALELDDGERSRLGHAARERVLAEHTSDIRARQLLAAFDQAHARQPSQHLAMEA